MSEQTNKKKPKAIPQTFAEAEYEAIIDAFSFTFAKCVGDTASLFDRRAGAAMHKLYSPLLDKLSLATFGERE